MAREWGRNGRCELGEGRGVYVKARMAMNVYENIDENIEVQRTLSVQVIYVQRFICSRS